MVQSFTYLGSLIDANNGISVEIKKKKRILLANRGFYGLKGQFRSQFLSIKNKIKLYKTLMRPVLAYMCMGLKLGYYQNLMKPD
jgi:hypothetical protein